MTVIYHCDQVKLRRCAKVSRYNLLSWTDLEYLQNDMVTVVDICGQSSLLISANVVSKCYTMAWSHPQVY